MSGKLLHRHKRWLAGYNVHCAIYLTMACMCILCTQTVCVLPAVCCTQGE